jgi:D-3-phosphoglycerate dehydrogenase
MTAHRALISAEYYTADGSEAFAGNGLFGLRDHGVEVDVLPEPVDEFTAEQLEGAHSLIMMGGSRVTPRSLEGVTTLRHIARYGSGFDSVDVEACADRGIVVTNTPDAVRQPMAIAALTMLLAVAHNLVRKDAITRQGAWGERSRYQGVGVEGATVGIVGFGGIGQETAKLVGAVGADVIVSNRSDNADTHHLIGARELGLMKDSAFLVNMARGNVIDEDALVRALEAGGIAGAGLDVFREEPTSAENPLLRMDNVTVAPHSLCWTGRFAAAVGASVAEAVLDIKEGRRPRHVVNPRVRED